MSTRLTAPERAKRLYDYAQARADEKGISLSELCRVTTLYSRVNRWKAAKEDPDIESLMEFADAMDISLGQVLLEGGYGTSAELFGVTEPKSVDLRAAIDRSQLDDEQKFLMHAYFEWVTTKAADGRESFVVKPRRRATRR